VADWNSYLSDEDIFVAAQYEGVRYLKRPVVGKHPALLVVDVNFHFLGPRPLPLPESILDWPLSCGPYGWKALPSIEVLLREVRRQKYPVIYTSADPDDPACQRGPMSEGIRGGDVPGQIASHPGDLMLMKSKPSSFFETQLVSHLIRQHVDTVLVAGCTTSGCVLSTVVDAASYGFDVIVPEEAVFDRIQASHVMSLFGMQMKYAHVVPVEHALAYIRSPDEGLTKRALSGSQLSGGS
jgi:maleamate amidohydrolase